MSLWNVRHTQSVRWSHKNCWQAACGPRKTFHCKTFETGQKDGPPFFTSCALIQSTGGVPNNLLCLQNVSKRYILQKGSQTHGPRAACATWEPFVPPAKDFGMSNKVIMSDWCVLMNLNLSRVLVMRNAAS